MFKVGDRVVCVEGDLESRLREGNTYTVKAGGGRFVLLDTGDDWWDWWPVDRFRLAEPEPPAPTLTEEEHANLLRAVNWFAFQRHEPAIFAWIEYHYSRQPKADWWQDEHGRWRRSVEVAK